MTVTRARARRTPTGDRCVRFSKLFVDLRADGIGVHGSFGTRDRRETPPRCFWPRYDARPDRYVSFKAVLDESCRLVRRIWFSKDQPSPPRGSVFSLSWSVIDDSAVIFTLDRWNLEYFRGIVYLGY